uniref:Transmembrane protein n=1 Tax=Caenorhabditis tropicalis TaxID=1561998 RepID=A0A1I7U3Q3_9PELO
MRGALLLLIALFFVSVLLISTTQGHPFFVALHRIQDADSLMSKRALDKCGCNLGCFYSSARDCMSCCALAL